MRIFLSGPMRDKPFFNKQAFEDAAVRFRALRHEVWSPFEEDQNRWGARFWQVSPTGNIDELRRVHEVNMKAIFGHDCDIICRWADTIVMLPEWEYSGGARAEHAVATYLRHKVIYL